jgi:hypothetical protein
MALRETMAIAWPTPTQRDRAIRLLAHEARGDESAEALAAAAERVCQRLSLHSGKVLGVDTFNVLLARALALVKADFPFIEAVTAAPPQAGLTGLRESLRASAASQASDAIVAVVAAFLALLTALIGDEPTLSVLVEVWAERSLAM